MNLNDMNFLSRLFLLFFITLIVFSLPGLFSNQGSLESYILDYSLVHSALFSALVGLVHLVVLKYKGHGLNKKAVAQLGSVAFEDLDRLASEKGWTLEQQSSDTRHYTLPMSWRSWGDTLIAKKDVEGKMTISSRPTLRTILFDFGSSLDAVEMVEMEMKAT